MPLRDYRCTKCERVYLDVLEKPKEHMEVCEDCGGLVERVLSLSNFQLNGERWAKDNYGLKDSKPKSD